MFHFHFLIFRQYEREQKRGAASVEEDMVFSGGLRIPGKIWHKLYRYNWLETSSAAHAVMTRHCNVAYGHVE